MLPNRHAIIMVKMNTMVYSLLLDSIGMLYYRNCNVVIAQHKSDALKQSYHMLLNTLGMCTVALELKSTD